MGSNLLHADRQTDKQDEANSHFYSASTISSRSATMDTLNQSQHSASGICGEQNDSLVVIKIRTPWL